MPPNDPSITPDIEDEDITADIFDPIADLDDVPTIPPQFIDKPEGLVRRRATPLEEDKPSAPLTPLAPLTPSAPLAPVTQAASTTNVVTGWTLYVAITLLFGMICLNINCR